MRNRLSGLYLVVDPSIPEHELLLKLEGALRGGADVLQVWNPWEDRRKALALARKILRTSRKHGVPLIVDDDLQLAMEIGADGLHLEKYVMSPKEVRRALGADVIVGYTCGNDLEIAARADREEADYISFCAIFPSPSVQDCEIVPLEKVKEAKRRFRIPVFASGGITAENAHLVLKAGADGIAVISAIFKAPDAEQAARKLKSIIVASAKVARRIPAPQT